MVLTVRGIRGVSPEEEKKAIIGKIWEKQGMKEWGVMGFGLTKNRPLVSNCSLTFADRCTVQELVRRSPTRGSDVVQRDATTTITHSLSPNLHHWTSRLAVAKCIGLSSTIGR